MPQDQIAKKEGSQPRRKAGAVAGRNAKVLTASLIALTSVLGAAGAWRASVAADGAANAGRKAYTDSVDRAHARATILFRTDAVLLDFVRMLAFEDRARALRKEAAAAAPASANRLRAQAHADELLALYIRGLLDRDALRPDGSLDLERKFDLEYIQAAQDQDLEPGPELALAVRMESKAEGLILLTALFVAAALFFTLAQISQSRMTRQSFLVGGIGVLLTTLVLVLLVELP